MPLSSVKCRVKKQTTPIHSRKKIGVVFKSHLTGHNVVAY